MSDLTAYFSDHRRRNLAILAAAALACLLLAFFAIRLQEAELRHKFAAQPFFPGLADQARNAARIHIVSNKGSFDVARGKGDNWILPQRANFPASFDQVQKTLVGLAALETIEPKTARPDWFHFVDLDPPPKGNGTLIEVRDATGHELASVIFGASEDIGDPGGATGLFARKPSDSQSWLVRSVIEPKGDPSDWMDKTFLNVDRARIQEVDVTPASGPSYVVRRDKAGDPDFKLVPVPGGRELSNEAAADGVASALTGFTFDDARPASQFDFAKSSRHVTKTFDGLTVTARVIQSGSDYWAQLTAQAASTNPDAATEAHDINAHGAAWVYKLPTYKGQQFMVTRESLLKPTGATAKTDQ
jgi:hypothetical protein